MATDTTAAPRPANPLDSMYPEDRAAVGRSARERNRPSANKPARKPHKFRVSVFHKGEERIREVEAADAAEAWALFCDEWKTWPSPAYVDRKIEDLDAA